MPRLLAMVMIACGALSTWAVADEKPFVYEDLVRLIEQKNIRSIEELLPLLPEELRSDPVLAYSSRSTESEGHEGQEASPSNPRAILYGNDGKLILTLNGDEKQKGFNTLEITQFRGEKNQFEYRQIRFPKKSEGPEKKVEFSGPNPKACLSCHGAQPKPIWDTYPFWPGMFGSEDDFSQSHYEQELEWISQFDTAKSFHPRYRFLSDKVGKGKERNNLILGILLLDLDVQSLVAAIASDKSLAKKKYALLFAAICRDKLSELEELTGGKGSIFSPSRSLKTIQAELRQQYSKMLADRLQRQRSLVGMPKAQSRFESHASADAQGYHKHEDPVIAGLVGLLRGSKVDVANYSMWFRSKNFVFADGLNSSSGIAPYLVESLLDPVQDHQLLEMLENYRSRAKRGARGQYEDFIDKAYSAPAGPDLNQVCSLLKSKSKALHASSKLRKGHRSCPTCPIVKNEDDHAGAIQLVAAVQKAVGPMASCIACHTGPNPSGPPIPFDQKKTFLKALNLPVSPGSEVLLRDAILKRLHMQGERKMPPDQDLDDEQISEIEKYMRTPSKPGR